MAVPKHLPRQTIEAFLRHVVKTDDCWNWLGCVTYGNPTISARSARAVSWIISFGDLPVGMSVVQKCAGQLCTRPDHLVLLPKGTHRTLEQRFWEKVEKSDGCWLWTGAGAAVNKPTMGAGGREDGLIHPKVVSWELHFGEVPNGMHVLQNCRSSLCVRPDHMFLSETVIKGTLKQRFWESVQKVDGDGCWLWMAALSKGYGVIMSGGPGSRHMRASHAAWELEHGPVPKDKWVLHRCDNPRCVRASHLFLGTALDNSHDCIAKGRNYRGEDMWTAKLTEDDVRMMRKLFDNGMTQAELETHFSISRSVVSLIVRRKSWKHVKD